VGVLLMLGIYSINPVDLPKSRSVSDMKKLPGLKQAVRIWKSLLVLAFTGFAVGGWWELMAASQIDGFWGNWFAGPGQPIISVYWKTEFLPHLFFTRYHFFDGLFNGFALFGLFHGIKRVLNPGGNHKEIAWLRLILIWFFCWFTLLVGVQYLPLMNTSTRAMWKMFLLSRCWRLWPGNFSRSRFAGSVIRLF